MLASPSLRLSQTNSSRGTSRSCAVITGPDSASIERQIRSAEGKVALFELRLDMIGAGQLPQTLPDFPFLFTFGTLLEEEIERLCAEYQPSMIRFPSGTRISFAEKLKGRFPHIELLISHHDFAGVPDLEKLSLSLFLFPADLYKIGATPSSLCEVKKLLSFHAESPSHWNLIPMGSGLLGLEFCATKYKGAVEYFFLEKSTGAGQLPLDTPYALPSHDTALYRLIGNPVEQSPSHITHNARLGKKGVYLKIALEKEELASFLSWAPQLGFKGLSVTIPFKEEVLPLLSDLSPEAKAIGAVNTIRYEAGEVTGYNTDGVGAVAALEAHFPLQGQKILLLGAGGTARAIAYEACKRGALITITSRSETRAKALPYPTIPWEQREEFLAREGAIAINVTPDSSLRSNFDVNFSSASPFALAMFEEQAARQFAIWL